MSGMNFKNTLPYSVFCQKAPSFSRFGCLESFCVGKSHTFRFYRMCCGILSASSRREAGDSSARWVSGPGTWRFPASALSGLRRFRECAFRLGCFPVRVFSGSGAFRFRRSPARVFFNAGAGGTFRLRANARPGTRAFLQSTSGSLFFRRVSCAGGAVPFLCFVQVPPSAAAACGILCLIQRREAGMVLALGFPGPAASAPFRPGVLRSGVFLLALTARSGSVLQRGGPGTPRLFAKALRVPGSSGAFPVREGRAFLCCADSAAETCGIRRRAEAGRMVLRAGVSGPGISALSGSGVLRGVLRLTGRDGFTKAAGFRFFRGTLPPGAAAACGIRSRRMVLRSLRQKALCKL